MDLGFCILDLGFWILDLGFWNFLVSVLFVAAPNAAVWILDLGFGILDFGSWILDFGSWILDLGFWIFDFAPRFAFCIRLLLLHADSGRRIIYHIPLGILNCIAHIPIASQYILWIYMIERRLGSISSLKSARLELDNI